MTHPPRAAGGSSMESTITDQEFALFQRLIYKIAGISLSEAKKVLLVGRLTKRLKHYNFGTFSQYYRMLAGGHHPEEIQVMVDLLTTNETYFFREPGHFHFLRDEILAPRRSTALPAERVWEAFRDWSRRAASSGRCCRYLRTRRASSSRASSFDSAAARRAKLARSFSISSISPVGFFSATKYLLSFGVDYGEVYGEMEFSSIEPVGDQRGAADGQPNHERLPVSLMFTQA